MERKCFLQSINVKTNYILRIEKGLHVTISQVSMPQRSGPNKKIVSIQQLIRDKYTEPVVLARLVPKCAEVVNAFLEFKGPAQVNFIVDCKDPEDKFVQVQMKVVEDLKQVEEGGEEELEEGESFELE